MITQGEFGFKHVALLRKLIVEKRTGTALFDGDEFNCKIAFDRGQISANASESLARILESAVLRMEWIKGEASSQYANLTVQSRKVFSDAIPNLNVPVRRMVAYRNAMERLPNIRIRHLSIFRSDPEHQHHFHELYRMSLLQEGVHLSEYFANTAEISELRLRINIAIGAYCLGDLIPVQLPTQHSTPVESSAADSVRTTAGELVRSGVVSRIMTRLRVGMHA